MRDILYDIDKIVVHLNKIECYITTDLDIDSTTPQNEEVVMNATPINMVSVNFSPSQTLIIQDE